MNNDAAVLTQAARLSLIKQWEDSRLSAEDFLATQPAQHYVLRHLSAKTLYRWRKLLADSGPDALAPQYNRPKGAGVLTLTKRDKALIQRYYLHQNQLPLAKVIDMIEQAEGVKIAYNTALRYIQSLPEALIIRGVTARSGSMINACPIFSETIPDIGPCSSSPPTTIISIFSSGMTKRSSAPG